MMHLFCSNFHGQHVDTLNTTWYKKLFNSKNNYSNDWNFEEEDDFTLDQKKYSSLKNEFDLGALLYVKIRLLSI